MKILFDSQIFDWQLNGGISRYFIEVLRRLETNKETEVLFKVRHSYNTYIQHSSWLTKGAVLKNLQFKGKLGALKVINEKLNRPYSNGLLKKNVPDIFHPTYYDTYFLKYLKQKPLVLTVYDLTHEKFNSNSASTRKVLAWKKKLIGIADHIISISENTKKDIVEFYRISPEKITTTYLSGGFDSIIREAETVEEMKKIPANYILFVGNRRSYKNFRSFICEVAPVILKNDIYLVTAGGGPLDPGEPELMKKMGIADRVISFSHVSDQFLAQLYGKALVFIFPSLYEGFGIPVLEAMQCGCPALLSSNSSLPEVGGSAAAYFDPFTTGELQKKLQELIADGGERNRMRNAGMEQVKKFSWDNTAREHIRVYKNLLQ